MAVVSEELVVGAAMDPLVVRLGEEEEVEAAAGAAVTVKPKPLSGEDHQTAAVVLALDFREVIRSSWIHTRHLTES